jgi:hypothetical protein
MTNYGGKLPPSVKPDAERKRRQRARLQGAGLKPYELWLKPAEWQAVKRLVERLRARK